MPACFDPLQYVNNPRPLERSSRLRMVQKVNKTTPTYDVVHNCFPEKSFDLRGEDITVLKTLRNMGRSEELFDTNVSSYILSTLPYSPRTHKLRTVIMNSTFLFSLITGS